MDNGTLLRTDNLTKSFGALVANDEISISVPQGEIRGIIGPNGSGKSTFFNTVSSFYEADSGSVYFNGEDVTGYKPHELAQKGLVRTFQIVQPFEELTVRENLLAVYSGGFRITDEKRARAEEVLELVELEEVAENDAKELSGGQQKLLEFGRVLMLEPECIMLDEPTAGINPALEDRLLKYIEAENEKGTTFIIIEHDMKVMKDTADTVTVFNQGQIIAEGPFDEVKELDTVRDAYLGGTEDDDDIMEVIQ